VLTLFAHAAFDDGSSAETFADLAHIGSRAFEVKHGGRATTFKSGTVVNACRISSVMPSQKKS